MKAAFVPDYELNDYATCAVGYEVWTAVTACQRGDPHLWGLPRDNIPPRACFIVDLCEMSKVNFAPVLVLMRDELPSFHDQREFIRVDIAGDTPAFVDAAQTAWALLVRARPILAPLCLRDGTFIQPEQLEDWARSRPG